MTLNNEDYWFDHSVIEDLWFDKFLSFLSAKYWEEVANEYKDLTIWKEVRITLLHYRNHIISKYNPYYVPQWLENKGLYAVSHPLLSKETYLKLRDESITQKQVQEILQWLTNI